MNYGVDRYNARKKSRCKKRKPGRKVAKRSAKSGQYALAYPAEARGRETVAEARRYPSEPQENLLYFMRKMRHCWNHGSVKFCVLCVSEPVFLSAKTDSGDERRLGDLWHYTILNHLYDEGKVTERFCWSFCTATPMWSSSRPITARVQRHQPVCPRVRHVPGY